MPCGQSHWKAFLESKPPEERTGFCQERPSGALGSPWVSDLYVQLCAGRRLDSAFPN